MQGFNAHLRNSKMKLPAGRKFLENMFRFKKKAAQCWTAFSIHDASMSYLIIELLFTKAVNASPFNKF
jgi:hypothetical protein